MLRKSARKKKSDLQQPWVLLFIGNEWMLPFVNIRVRNRLNVAPVSVRSNGSDHLISSPAKTIRNSNSSGSLTGRTWLIYCLQIQSKNISYGPEPETRDPRPGPARHGRSDGRRRRRACVETVHGLPPHNGASFGCPKGPTLHLRNSYINIDLVPLSYGVGQLFSSFFFFPSKQN